MAPTIPPPSVPIPVATPVTVPADSSIWDRVSNWVSENKAVVYTIAGVSVVITTAGVVYYLRKESVRCRASSSRSVSRCCCCAAAAAAALRPTRLHEASSLFVLTFAPTFTGAEGVRPQAQQEGKEETEAGREGGGREGCYFPHRRGRPYTTQGRRRRERR